MSKKGKKSKKREDEEKIVYLALTFLMGPALIGVGLWSLNFVGVGVGVFLEAWGIWGLPEIHPYLKMVPKFIINWKSRKQSQHMSQSPGGQQYQAGRDMTVIVPPAKESTPDDLDKATRVQLADRVYNPLIQEVETWKDPIRATCPEWKRLQLAERRLVLKVPDPIASRLNTTANLFDERSKLHLMLNEYCDEMTRTELIRSKLVNAESLGTYQFRAIGEPGVDGYVNIPWIWEYETDLSNYLWDYIQSLYPQKIKWRLEIWVYPPTTGVRAVVGGETETRSVINHVLRLLMSKPFARELQECNKQIRELGKELTSLIDEELKKS